MWGFFIDLPFLEFICSIHRAELPFFHLFLCTFDDTQDLLLSDVKLPSPPRLHQQFILLSLLSPTLYARSLLSSEQICYQNSQCFILTVGCFLLLLNNAAWCTATLRKYLRGVHPQSDSWKRHRCL